MRYLIDTNILLFTIKERDRISSDVFELLFDSSNTINISSRSIEEIILLLRIGKIEFSRWKETKDDHKDPVDHAIMAHAITNKTTLISSDSKMRFYQEQGLDFIWNKA